LLTTMDQNCAGVSASLPPTRRFCGNAPNTYTCLSAVVLKETDWPGFGRAGNAKNTPMCDYSRQNSAS
jgi:hypothetical protein